MAKKKDDRKKILIESSALNKALKDVSAAVQVHTVLPILLSVHCSTTKDSMTIMACDLAITVITKVKCDCSGEFVFLIPHAEVLGITGKIASQPITIIVEDEICIEDAEGKFTLGKAESPEHFPKRKEMDEKYRATVDEQFLKALQKSKNCVSTLENDVVFTNVLIDIDEEKSMVLSSDKMRMYRHKQKVGGGKLKALVTTHFIKAISGMKEAELFGNDEWIVARSGDLEVIDKTAVFTNYPNCSFFFDNYKHNIKLAASDLISRLDEILIFKNSFYMCELIFQKDKIVVKYDDNETNKHYEKEFKAKHTVELEKITFNVRDLKNLLMLLEEDEINVYIKDHTQGAHFDSEYGETNLFIMPLMG